MRAEFGVPVSYAGIVFGIIAAGTIVSSLASDYLTKKLGAGKVTAVSVGNRSFYRSIHYEYVSHKWIGLEYGISLCWAFAGVFDGVTFFSLPLWHLKSGVTGNTAEVEPKTLSLLQILSIPGAKAIMIMFFCYCALEQTTGLWASSYLVMHKGIVHLLDWTLHLDEATPHIQERHVFDCENRYLVYDVETYSTRGMQRRLSEYYKRISQLVAEAFWTNSQMKKVLTSIILLL